MAITVKHNKVSTIPDGTDTSVVRPSDWNDDHVLTGTIPVANGGTGASTASDGLNALLPSQTSNTGKVLTTDGTNASWATNGSGTVTSVAATVPAFLSVSGSPITTSGTLALTYSGTALPVANGGTGVTTSSGANSVVLRDSNVNINANAFNDGYTNTAASGTQIVLTAASVRRYTITGSGGQTIKLPDATTLSNGEIFEFDNNQSSGAITVNNNSNTLVVSVPSGGLVRVNLLSNATAAGSWDRHDYAPANVSWSTNTFDYAGSITSATWNGSTVQVNRGGTGATTLTGYVKGSGTSALTATSTIPTTDLSGTITNAQLANSAITINGTSTSLGGSISVGTVTSVTGTSPVVSSGGNTPAISMPAATSSVNGYLTSADWTTFNGKQPAGTYVTSVAATSPVTSSGGTTPTIAMPAATTSVNGYLTSTDWTTFNNKGSGTVTSVAAITLGTTGTDLSSTVATGTTTPVITLQVPTASATNRGALSAADWTTFNNKGSGTVTSVTGTAPVVSSGGTTPAISMAAATGSVNGYLTSTDWTTFNNKGSGTVTAVSVASANGFAGTSSGGATPALTLTTSISGVLKGSSSALAAATAGTDFVAPATATNFTAQQYFGNVALTDAATVAWAANTAQVATFTFVSSNRTMGAPTGLVSGAYYGLAVIQNSGSNTLTWNSVFKWAGGTAPTLSTAASAKDYFVFRTDGTNLYEQGRSLGVA